MFYQEKRRLVAIILEIGGIFRVKLCRGGLIALTIRVYLGGVNRVGVDDGEKPRRKLAEA